MLTNLFKRRPANTTPALTREDFTDMLRITRGNVRLLTSTQTTLQATLNTLNPRRNKKKFAELQTQVSFIEKRLQEEIFWKEEFSRILNSSN